MRFISAEELKEGDTILIAGYEEGVVSDFRHHTTPFGTQVLTVRFTSSDPSIEPSTRYFSGSSQKIILLSRKSGLADKTMGQYADEVLDLLQRATRAVNEFKKDGGAYGPTLSMGEALKELYAKLEETDWGKK